MQRTLLRRLACAAVVAAAAACLPALAEAPISSDASARKEGAPLGPLSLLALGGTLVAGLVAGAGLASLQRNRRLPLPAALGRFARSAAGATSSRKPVAARAKKATPIRETVPEPRHPLPVPGLKVLPVAARLDSTAPGARIASVERWIVHLADGPKFSPRIIGLLAEAAVGKDQALAEIAQAAQAADRDVVIVCTRQEGPDGLAEALDARLSPRSRRADPFGASASVEIVPLADLLGRGSAPKASALRDSFERLAARCDLVLIDAPPLEAGARMPSLLGALDGLVLIRSAATDADTLASYVEEARVAGIDIDAQIVVADAV